MELLWEQTSYRLIRQTKIKGCYESLQTYFFFLFIQITLGNCASTMCVKIKCPQNLQITNSIHMHINLYFIGLECDFSFLELIKKITEHLV